MGRPSFAVTSSELRPESAKAVSAHSGDDLRPVAILRRR